MNKTGSNEFDGILNYLKKMAKIILDKNSLELQDLKSTLEKHTNLSSKPKGFQDEMEKCRVVASEWITLYRNPKQIDNIQNEILNESVSAFFLIGNDAIVEYQKNYFLLSMVDELLDPMDQEHTEVRKSKLVHTYLQRIAREKNQLVKCHDEFDFTKRRWFFSNEKNILQSNENGLSDDEAIEYLDIL